MKKLNQKGFHHVFLILVIVVFGVIGFVGYKVMQKSRETNGTNKNQPNTTASQTPVNSQSFAAQYSNACKDRNVSFTSPPIAFDQMGYIEPLGKVSDGHVTPTDHVYVGPLNQQAADNTTDVLMPADGTVVQIDRMPTEYIGDKNQTTAPEDHRLVIAFSCRYYAIFIHVHQLAPALASAAGQQEPNSQKMVSVELKAGDKIGKIGGNAFDWSPIDTTKTLAGFITPSKYNSESWKINVVSPFDLYTGNLKTQMEAKSLRTKAPLGGKIDWDQPGKLIGNWFRSGTGGYDGSGAKGGAGRYWDGHLSLAPDYLDGTTTVVSIGNWDGVAKQFAAKGGFDPAGIGTKDGVQKVELTSVSYTQSDGMRWSGGVPKKGMTVNTSGTVAGTILFEVQSGEKLKVEKFIGKSAAQVNGFTADAQTYER